jgi:hypothetical protein
MTNITPPFHIAYKSFNNSTLYHIELLIGLQKAIKIIRIYQ